jgi:hypothetical protein
VQKSDFAVLSSEQLLEHDPSNANTNKLHINKKSILKVTLDDAPECQYEGIFNAKKFYAAFLLTVRLISNLQTNILAYI